MIYSIQDKKIINITPNEMMAFLMNKMPDKSFQPKGKATRAEVAIILVQMINGK